MIAAVVVLVVVLLLLARYRRKGRRNAATDGLRDLLEQRRPYDGPRWRVGDRWL